MEKKAKALEDSIYVDAMCYDQLSQQLAKAAALSQVTLIDGFLDSDPFKVYDYLWLLSEIVESAQSLCEKLAEQ